MAAPTNAAYVKKVLANSGPSTHGTSLRLPRRGSLHLDFGDIYPDYVADGDKSDEPVAFHHGHVAESAFRHFRHQPVGRVGLPRRNHSLGHEVRDWLLQDLGAALADGPHEIALRHYARDLVVVLHDDDAANAMLLEQLCDIEQ